MIIQFSAQIDSAKANKDRTLTLKVETQELPREDTAYIFELFDKQIWIALAETAITKEDLHIPELVDPLDKKSPSQRQRDRMFVYWKEKKIGGNFNEWYEKELDKNGQSYLDRLV